MSKIFTTTQLASLLLCIFTIATPAAAVSPADGGQMHGMMMDKMDMTEKERMADNMCPLGHGECPKGKHDCMNHRKHHGPAMGDDKGHKSHGMGMPMQPGMMQHRMDRVFYLDRIDELGLSTEQVAELKTIRSECRGDNIRQAAEAKITRLELMEILEAPDWDLKQVEPLVRKSQQQETDMQIRHLKAMQDARKVLTAEQREKADSDVADLEDLFE